MKDCKARSGADGNDRLLKAYGGHSTGVARYPYANGGAVTGKSAPAYAKGGSVEMEGGSAAPRLDRPGRMKMSKKGDKGKKGTNVNVVVMAGKPDSAAPPMAPPPPDAGPMPPPPMRAFGGKVVARKHGGAVKKADGGSVEDKDMAGKVGAGLTGVGLGTMAASAGKMLGRTGRIGKAIGAGMTATGLGLGAKSIQDKDAKEAARKKEMAEDGKEDRRANGGRVKMTAGAATGEGRLEKAKWYGE